MSSSMSDTVRAAKFEVSVAVREAAAKLQLEYRPVEFNLHSCYYRDFFLLRTPIAINGHPATIEVVEGVSMLVYGSKPGGSSKSVELSTISLKAVGPVLAKHGVYHVDTYYHEQLSLYSIKFLSKSSLKQFLSDKEAVQKELSSAIAKVCAVNDKDRVSVEAELYLVSPTAESSPAEVHQVNLGNYPSIAQTWRESKLFDFNTTMFTKGKATNISGVCDSAELSDLQKELMGVIAWFSLGVQLKIPKHDLLAIRRDHHFTADCRLEMLLRWEQLEIPTWSKLVSALVNIGRKCLAEELAVKYGLPHPFQASAKESVPSEVLLYEQQLLSKMKELENAKQLKNDTTKRLEKQVRDEVPRLQAEVKSLMKETNHLNKLLILRDEEIKLFKELKPSVNQEQLQVLDRLVKEKSEHIKSLQDELNSKEKDLKRNRETLREKEREIAQLMDKLSTKSAQVLQLEGRLEKLNHAFTQQQEEMNRKLIEESAAHVSQETYIKELQIQHDCAVEEASKKKEEIQHYSQQLAVQEKEISRLEKELLRLREEMDAHPLSEQLSAGRVNQDEERARQLLNSTTRIKLQLQQMQEHQQHQSVELERAMVKHERAIDQSNLALKIQLQQIEEQQRNQQRRQLEQPHRSLEKHGGATDLTKLTFRKGPKAPTKMAKGSSAITGKVAYFNTSSSKIVHTLHTTTRQWGQLPTECPYINSTLVSINQELSSVGGVDTTTNHYTNKVCTYRDGWWVELYPPMHTKRKRTVVLSTATHIVAMGGYGGHPGSYLTTTEVLNLATRQWATATPLPYATYQASATLCMPNVYLMGGYALSKDFSVITCNIEHLLESANKTETGTHRQQSSSESKASHSNLKVWHNITELPVRFSTCDTVRGHLVAIGGRDRQDKPSNTIYRYNKNTNEWIKTGRLNIPRSRCLATALSDNSLLVSGGVTDSGWLVKDSVKTDKTEIATFA